MVSAVLCSLIYTRDSWSGGNVGIPTGFSKELTKQWEVVFAFRPFLRTLLPPLQLAFFVCLFTVRWDR